MPTTVVDGLIITTDVDRPPEQVPENFGALGWQAWYDNGHIYDSHLHRWEDLPDDGLQVVQQYRLRDLKPVRTIDGFDWYCRAIAAGCWRS